jgi:hypothetical protein
MGVAATLILIIILTQSRFFDFLIDSALGRAILIFYILGISYVNKIFGVVAVLFIIIMFNQSNIGYLEGFTNTQNNQKNDEKEQQSQNQLTQEPTKASSSVVVPTIKPSKPLKEPNVGHEGFNMIDREGSMQKGKRSNEVPVFSNSRNQTDDIEPSDKNLFTSSFSLF